VRGGRGVGGGVKQWEVRMWGEGREKN